jgi:hypothetical protein
MLDNVDVPYLPQREDTLSVLETPHETTFASLSSSTFEDEGNVRLIKLSSNDFVHQGLWQSK